MPKPDDLLNIVTHPPAPVKFGDAARRPRFTCGYHEQADSLADNFLKRLRPRRVNRQVVRQGCQYFPEQQVVSVTRNPAVPLKKGLTGGGG
ncbi:MAG: hypothetical protein WCD80_16125 [Desulfobaccales bacterium]